MTQVLTVRFKLKFTQEERQPNMFLVYGDYIVSDEKIVSLAHRYTVARKLFAESSLAGTYQVIKTERANFDVYRVVHDSQYIDLLERISKTGKEARGIPAEGIEFERVGVGGTLTATCLAFEKRCFAYHLGGGYHHGMPDGPNGIDYCNDVAMALEYLLRNGVKRILYIDLDAHHPDGVQKIFESEKRIMQISLHQWLSDTKEAHYSNIGKGEGIGRRINMPLPRHTGDRAYLQLLHALLVSVMRRYKPEVVVYQAGVDPYYQDPIGCLNLSLRGLYERDKLVASTCMSPDVPFITVLGGGYHSVGAPKAVVNTLAAFAGQNIVFDESESIGSSSASKAFKWYAALRAYLSPYIELDPIADDEQKEVAHA